MAHQEVWILLASLVGFVLGGWHLCWMTADHDSPRGWWSRCMGIASLLWLGSNGLVAAALQSPGLVPLGLLAGLLTVAMLWERPEPSWEPPIVK